MTLKNSITPHCHIQSLDSASSPDAFAEREVELQTGAITCTDHGWLGAVPKVYELAKKHKLTPILGIEAYFRDDNCPILTKAGVQKDDKGTFKSHNKYMHLCIHCQDQAAYTELVKETSWSFLNRGEQHGSEIKPLMDWNQLERLGQYNITATSGCLIGVVARHLMQGEPEIATQYYEKMRSLVKPGNFYVEVFPHQCTHYWDKGVYLTLQDGRVLRYRHEKKLRVDVGEPLEVTAQQVVDKFDRWIREGVVVKILAFKHYHKWTDVEPGIVTGVKAVEGFQLNECNEYSPDGDIQAPANRFLIELANKYGDPILISDDSHMATPEDKIIQDTKLTSGHGSWKFHTTYSRLSTAEFQAYFKDVLKVSEKTMEGWIDNSYAFRDKFKDFKFEVKPRLPSNRYPADTVAHLRGLIAKHGRMRWNSPEYIGRLKQEINLLHNNGTIDLLPYFFLAEESLDVYHQRGDLVGPGRGSSGGVLINYLIGVTSSDPIKWGLSLDRFITEDRIASGKMPDIDMDLPDVDVLKAPETGWLAKEFGNRAAIISTRTGLRLKSSIKDVMRSVHGHVSPEVEAVCAQIPNPPQGIRDSDFVFGYTSEDGQEHRGLIEESEALSTFAKKYPSEWKTVSKMISGVHRGFGRHASAVLVSDIPVSDFIPVCTVSGVVTTQYEMTGVEAMGGLKMDWLGINTLKDIAECVRRVQEKSGLKFEPATINGVKVLPHQQVPHNGKSYFVWDLPEDPAVFRDICEGNTETVFQLGGAAALEGLREFNHWRDQDKGIKALASVMDLATFTALDRPGPLDAFVTDPKTGARYNMLQEYARRARGEPPIGSIAVLDQMLPETFGVLCFQEQLEQVYRTMTGCSGAEAVEFRSNIGKKKMAKVEAAYPEFIRRASEKIGEDAAKALWGQIYTFGQYGFNKSHSVNYAIIAYTCAFLKYHHPLEWWASVCNGLLNNGDRKKIFEKYWGFVKSISSPPDVRYSGNGFVVRDGKIVMPLSIVEGIGPKANQELVERAPYASLEDFCRKLYNDRVKNGVRVEPKPLANGKPSKAKVKIKLGKTALNSGVVKKLLAAGVFDSVFPAGTSVADKIYAYETTMAALAGGKPEPVDPCYTSLDSIGTYQLRKKLFPASFEDLLSAVQSVYSDRFGTKDGETFHLLDKQTRANIKADGLACPQVVKVYTDADMKHLQTFEPPEGVTVIFGGYFYVSVSGVIKYPKADPKYTAYKLKLCTSNNDFEVVQWPVKKKSDKPLRPQPEAGSVIFALLSKTGAGFGRSTGQLQIMYQEVLRPPLELKEGQHEEEPGSTKNVGRIDAGNSGGQGVPGQSSPRYEPDRDGESTGAAG